MPVEPRASFVLEGAVEGLRCDARFDGLLVFGSCARGDDSATSDVDLIAVHRGPPPEDVLDGLSPRVSLAFYTPQRLYELPERSPLFANHLSREGVVVHDRSGVLSDVLSRVTPLDTAAVDRLAVLTGRRCDEVLSDPGFASSDRLSVAELYGLSKQAALIESARLGTYEFNRHRAFDLLGESRPHLCLDIENIAELEPTWLASRRTLCSPKSSTLSADPAHSAARVLRAVCSH